jgi:hypothetical protein
MNAVTSSYQSQSIPVRYNRTATRLEACAEGTDHLYSADLILMTDRLTVVGLRLMDSVFGLLLFTTEPSTGGGATGREDYAVVGIENLDC